MADLILKDVKTSVGILEDNLGFDAELLIYVNAAAAALVQIGLTDLDITIDEDTIWPALPNTTLTSLCKTYICLRVKMGFDPTSSETIMNSLKFGIGEMEGRIGHEVEEVTA